MSTNQTDGWTAREGKRERERGAQGQGPPGRRTTNDSRKKCRERWACVCKHRERDSGGCGRPLCPCLSELLLRDPMYFHEPDTEQALKSSGHHHLTMTTITITTTVTTILIAITTITSSPPLHHHHYIITITSSPLHHHHHYIITTITSSPPLHHHHYIITTITSSPPLHHHHYIISTITSSPPLHHRHHYIIATTASSPPLHHRHHCIITTIASSPPLHHHHRDHHHHHHQSHHGHPPRALDLILKTSNNPTAVLPTSFHAQGEFQSLPISLLVPSENLLYSSFICKFTGWELPEGTK